MKTVLWIAIIGLVIYLGIEIVPVMYKGVLGLRAICKENAEGYHKYGSQQVNIRIPEKFEELGIPRDAYEYTVETTKDKVVIWISYDDSFTLFNRYTKDMTFETECEGELKTVYR